MTDSIGIDPSPIVPMYASTLLIGPNYQSAKGYGSTDLRLDTSTKLKMVIWLSIGGTDPITKNKTYI
jgi:hypothetical protein